MRPFRCTPDQPPRRQLPRWLASLIPAAILALSPGCSSLPLASDDAILGPSYKPTNIHAPSPKLPAEVRRVAILPLASELTSVDAQQGRSALEPILWEEFGKAKRFELTRVTPEQLRQWTGSPEIHTGNALPHDFFDRLRKELACDAVLFSSLTQYKAYPPMSIGLNLRLVGVPDPKVLWSADEVFDAGNPAVVNGARRYQAAQPGGTSNTADSTSIMNSPRRFSRYAIETLTTTLPSR